MSVVMYLFSSLISSLFLVSLAKGLFYNVFRNQLFYLMILCNVLISIPLIFTLSSLFISVCWFGLAFLIFITYLNAFNNFLILAFIGNTTEKHI